MGTLIRTKMMKREAATSRTESEACSPSVSPRSSASLMVKQTALGSMDNLLL